MMRIKTIGLYVCVLALSLCLAASTAYAGIIITEGKIHKDCSDIEDSQPQPKQCRTTKQKKSKGKPVVGIAKPKSATQSGSDSSDLDSEGGPNLDGIEDLDNTNPAGWDCVDIGAGVEVCEPVEDAQGASPGAGPGGGLSGTTSAGEDTVMSTCTGGPVSHGGLWLLCLVFLLARRRMTVRA
jgi:hypothetical protein